MGSSSRRRVGAALLSITLGALVLVACGDEGSTTGHDSTDDVLAAYVEAGRTYDLAAGCRLRPPEQIEQFATADAVDPEGYCDFATAEVVEMADDATKARNEEIYTDPVIEPLSRSGGEWFRITAANGSYEEEVLLVEHDGRWYVGDIEAHIHDPDDDHGHEHDHTDEGDLTDEGDHTDEHGEPG